jgi:hypothetical protein
MLQGIQSGFSQAVALVLRWVPLFLAFLVILVIGYFVAKLIERAVDKILERVGFDRLVERGGVKRALSRSRYDASDLLGKVVYYTVMLFVLQLAFGVFGPNPVSTMLTGIVAYLPRVFVAGLIVIVGAAIAVAVRELVVASIGGLSYGKVTATVLGAAVMVVAVFAALDQLRIAPAIVTGLFYAALAAIAGAFIVAVGGGGIQTMRTYWERSAGRMEMEAPKLKQEAQQAPKRVEDRARMRSEQMHEAMR